MGERGVAGQGSIFMGRLRGGSGGGIRRERAGLVGTYYGTEGGCAKQSKKQARLVAISLRPNRRVVACLAQRAWLVQDSLEPTLLNVILYIGVWKGQRAGHPSMLASLYAMTIHSKRKHQPAQPLWAPTAHLTNSNLMRNVPIMFGNGFHWPYCFRSSVKTFPVML